jgi:hypothetical protein
LPRTGEDTRLRGRRVRTPVTWWTAILLITGVFQVYRGAPVDGCIFLAVAAVLAVDRLGALPAVAGRPTVPAGVLVAGATAVVLVATATPRYGTGDIVVVAAVGLVVLAYGWPQTLRSPPDAPDRPVRTAMVGWSVVGVATCGWELTEYFLGRPSAAASNDHPALSDLVDPLLHGAAGRAVFTVVWLLGLTFLLRRARPS